jgi:hypothetical protein
MNHLTLPLLLTLLAPIAAQQRSAHPQESLGIGSGNTTPLGWAGGIGAESRTQVLIPRQELPAVPALLTGIEVAGLFAGNLNYQMLGITCAPALISALDAEFATNLGPAPTVVVPPGPRAVDYSLQPWTLIAFVQPYQHDGHSDLVLEFRKVVFPLGSSVLVAHRNGSTPERADRPRMQATFGDLGSGAAFANTAALTNMTPLSLRLVWQQTPTLRHRSEVGASGNQFSLGGQVNLTVQGTPGHFFVMVAGIDWLPGQPLAGVLGELRLVARYTFRDAVLNAQGLGSHVVAIPNAPSIIGLRVTYQAAVVDPLAATITLTNGTDHFVNP